MPERYRVDFQRDPDAALRDICGVASASLLPFIGQRHKILAAVSRGAEPEHRLLPWTARAVWELANPEQGMPQILVDNLGPRAARELPHFAHVDLSISGNRCGVALARQNGTAVVETAPGVFSHAPFFEVPLALALQPSTQKHVDFGDLRAWLVQLAAYHGVNLVQVTFDGFQSRDSVQTLRKAGIRAFEQSVDRTTEPYDYLRRALYEDRVALPPEEDGVPDSDLLRVELAQLEFVRSKNKVDHPPAGSKDIADAVCGAIYSASQSPLVRYGAMLADRDGNALRPGLRPSARLRPAGRERPQFGRLQAVRAGLASAGDGAPEG